MINIAGGCICCSYGSDLVGALMELPERMPNMDGMLIEASGVALPAALSAHYRVPDYDRASVFVLADAETVASVVRTNIWRTRFASCRKRTLLPSTNGRLQEHCRRLPPGYMRLRRAGVLATEQSQLP